MILHNVSHKRSLSQSMSAASCIPSIFMTIDKSNSSRIKKLPSSYSSELAEGKVFPEKKKIEKRSFSLCGQFYRIPSILYGYYSVSSGGICQNRIEGIGLFYLSRSRPFLSWLCLGYLSPLNVS